VTSEPVWTSLEIAKLIVAGCIPVTVAVLAFVLNRVLKRAENRQWFSQKLVEKRIELLGEALPELNDLYCYFIWVGPWKELSPVDMLERKRRLDRLFYANRPFFSAEAHAAYADFIGGIFRTRSGPGRNAQLRTGGSSKDGNREHAFAQTWSPAWNDLFAPDDEHTPRERITERYKALLDVLGAEVGA
jgi:hypothetical protein